MANLACYACASVAEPFNATAHEARPKHQTAFSVKSPRTVENWWLCALEEGGWGGHGGINGGVPTNQGEAANEVK